MEKIAFPAYAVQRETCLCVSSPALRMRKRVLEADAIMISSSMGIITSMETSVDGYMVRWIALRLQGEQHKSSNVRIIYANIEIRVNA